jgi:group I intron endonuclease
VIKNLNDTYLGSGLLLQEAIKKHGLENFRKEYLIFCNSLEELNETEKRIVTSDIVKDPNSYNIATGGQGGNLGYAVNEKIGQSMSLVLKGRPKTTDHILSISKARKGQRVSEETKAAIGKTIKKIREKTDPVVRKEIFGHYGEDNGFYGKKHSHQSKQKIRDAIGDSRKRGSNPNAKSITFRGKTFSCKKDCAEYFHISKYTLNKLLGENNG